EGLRGFEDPQVISLEELQKIGRDYGAKNSDALDARLKGIGPEELAILIYTSGTTGKPKGGMHSHRGIISAMHGLNTLYPQYENDERMCFLPLCHVAERFWGEYFAVYTGTILNFVENPETVPENMQEIAPTVMTAVPRIWEKFYSSIMIAVKDATRLQQRTYQWSIGTGYKVADLVLVGKPVPSSLKAKFRIARVLTLDNIRRFIGIHRARYLNTGAAPISPELIRWYLALGIPMLEVWGMTETGAAMTAMPADGIRPGTIGRAASYAQVRLDPETKELQVRADSVFMGYLNLPEKTAEVFDEGRWLKTGDVGAVDEDGYFKIIDRMKEIILTAGGKNITPS
ncbi:MAG: AMP-binding protein, partial [Candidatus Omnitrophica bacterium]|nr:AMP-binding protein [Candidatus Omnitrophota bacterium]